MNPELLNLASTTAAAVSALAALAISVMALRHTKQTAQEHRRQSAHALDGAMQARLDPMYPDLREVLGHLEDGVPLEIRNVLIPFFVLYSDAFAAYRDGLFDPRDWQGFERELAFWAQKPVARRAWRAFRKQTWTEGFADHVDSVMAGPPAYPSLADARTSEPTVLWPESDLDDELPGRRP